MFIIHGKIEKVEFMWMITCFQKTAYLRNTEKNAIKTAS